jgi:hypothetical protein
VSIPFERDDFTFTVPFQFCRSAELPLCCPDLHAVQPEGQSFLAALSCRPARVSLIPSPVSLFCPGSAHSRHLMGFDEDRPANLTKAR